ncbi:MAG TPA: hypothetical protein VEO54_24420 [Thermoanaerobaculia bacterium]|nr:hypothetical protein [Thermoanaerobaculia bacterium]
MPVARSGVIWRRIFVVLLAVTVAAFVWSARREFTHGGSLVGLIFGTAGYLLILLLAYYGIRKRSYRSRFGTMEQWLQSHIYLGILVLVLLVLHTGGRFNDKVAVTTLILVAVVVLSGIAGAIFFVTVPRLLTEVESNLTVEEISTQLNQLARNMARLANGRSQPFVRIYDGLMKESMPGWLAGWRLLFSRMRRKSQQTAADWSKLLALVGKEEQEQLRQMLVFSRQRKELLMRLMYQQRYKNILEFWLYIHVPVTIAVLVFGTVHVVAVFYYGKVF